MQCPVWARRGCFKTVSEHYEDNYKRVTETIRLAIFESRAYNDLSVSFGKKPKIFSEDARLLTGQIQLLADLIMKPAVMVQDWTMINMKVQFKIPESFILIFVISLQTNMQ